MSVCPHHKIQTQEERFERPACRVIGIDADGTEPLYVIEIQNTDGSSSLQRADVVRKA